MLSKVHTYFLLSEKGGMMIVPLVFSIPRDDIKLTRNDPQTNPIRHKYPLFMNLRARILYSTNWKIKNQRLGG